MPGLHHREPGTLIGCAIGQSELLKRMVDFTGCSMQDAIRTAAQSPAILLGLGERKGRLAKGYDADVVVLDEDFDVAATVVGGRVVYRAG